MMESSSDIKIFQPSLDDFKDFDFFLQKMESEGAADYGIAKVIPPETWSASDNYEEAQFLKIETPYTQTIQIHNKDRSLGKCNYIITSYRDFFPGKPITVKDFFSIKNAHDEIHPISFKEKDVWENLTFNSTRMYGADVNGTLFSPKCKFWNLGSMENKLTEVLENKIDGLTGSYLYFGKSKTFFAWHVEDMDLYSINHLHFGAKKIWYSISLDDNEKFENLLKNLYLDEYKNCKEFIRHKNKLLPPSYLNSHGIKTNKVCIL